MAEETSVTLDDLLPVEWIDPLEHGESITGFQMCTRCCGVVYSDDRGEALAGHARWHAAIEDPVDDLDLPQFKTDEDSCAQHRDFISRVWQIAKEAGHHSDTSVTDFLRERLQADPPTVGEVMWHREFVNDVRVMAKEAGYAGGSVLDWLREQLAEQRHATATDATLTHEWSTQDMANTIASQGAALHRLRDVVRAAGCPLDTNVIDWIEERLNDLVGSDQREAALVEANKGLLQERDRLRAELAERRAMGDTTVVHKPFADPTSGIEQCRVALVNALEHPADDTSFRQAIDLVEILIKNRKYCRESHTGASAQTERPDDIVRLARSLGHALNVDPDTTNLAQMVELVEHVMYANSRCKTEHAGLSKGETDRLRRVEQALIDVGAPNRSERGDPGGLQVAWIQRQAERMRQAQMDKQAGPVEQVCPSLYLHNGTLHACAITWEHTTHESTAPILGTFGWHDEAAIPSPWPVDREPPAGIDILRDIDAAPDTQAYLVRVQNGTWEWFADPNDQSGPRVANPWAEAVLDVNGDLIVVRP